MASISIVFIIVIQICALNASALPCTCDQVVCGRCLTGCPGSYCPDLPSSTRNTCHCNFGSTDCSVEWDPYFACGMSPPQTSSALSGEPSTQPSSQPSTEPSVQPSGRPSTQPSCQPSAQPSANPTQQPSSKPSSQPSGVPSMHPSAQPPSSQPSSRPFSQPTTKPSSQPSSQPFALPSSDPTTMPQHLPSAVPSSIPSANPTKTVAVTANKPPNITIIAVSSAVSIVALASIIYYMYTRFASKIFVANTGSP